MPGKPCPDPPLTPSAWSTLSESLAARPTLSAGRLGKIMATRLAPSGRLGAFHDAEVEARIGRCIRNYGHRLRTPTGRGSTVIRHVDEQTAVIFG